jgi:hypothetical protein
MGDSGFIWLAIGLAIAGIGALRISWGRAERSSPLNLAGWGLLLGAAIFGGAGAGAWGIAVAAIGAMGVAMALLVFAAAKPNARRRSAQKILRDPNGKGSRGKATPLRALVTFLIAGPLCLVAAVALALAVRGGIVMAGGAEADGNVAVLGIVPLVWPLLAFAVMMIRRRSGQLALVLGSTAMSLPLLLIQGMTA